MKTLLITIVVTFAFFAASCGSDSSSKLAPGDYYTCPMHPQVHLDKSGVCPICHMDLVKASNIRTAGSSSDSSLISLSQRDQLLANVATTPVKEERIERRVRAFGSLEIPEPNKTIISARFNGRIEKLYVNAVGAKIKKGEPLFDIYSPDIIQAETEYQQAFKSSSTSRDNLLSIARSKLLLLGLTKNQIHDLGEKDSLPLVITYRSPISGIVIDKKIVDGIYIAEGASLYDVSDLSTLWNIADVYETDISNIRFGELAAFTTAGYPDETFKGTVSLIYPVVNSQSRTVKVRLTVNNVHEKLKPNMYTETEFMSKQGTALTIPVNAVLVTGKRNLVYVQSKEKNHFEAREIGIGSRFDGKYEVTWGLVKGDTVVSEGGYLIDSESQLKTGGGTEHQHGTAAPPKKENDMPGMKMD